MSTRIDADATAKQFLESAMEGNGQYAIAYALLRNAEALQQLGNGNAATQMGAVEGLGLVVKEAINELTIELGRALTTSTDDARRHNAADDDDDDEG